MTFSDSLSLAGIAISALFGIWGVHLAMRKGKYPASLTFVRDQSIALLEDFAKKLPNLSVLYRGTPIDRNLVLLSGYLVNDGAIDISKEMVEQPLICVLPNGCKWLEFKVTTAAPSLMVDSQLIDEAQVKVTFGLFRRNESFSFQALALLDEKGTKTTASHLASEIEWKHRIASLDAVKTQQIPANDTERKKKRRLRVWTLAAMSLVYLLTGMSQITGIGPLGAPPSILYRIESPGRAAVVTLSPNKDGTTTIEDVETEKTETVQLGEFERQNTLTPIQSDKPIKQWKSIAAGSMMVFGALLILFAAFINDYRIYRLRKLVAASAREV